MRNAPCVLTSAKDLLCVEKKKKQPTANDGFPIATHYSPFSLRVIREHRANMLQLTRPGDILGVCWQKCVQRRMDELNKATMFTTDWYSPENLFIFWFVENTLEGWATYVYYIAIWFSWF